MTDSKDNLLDFTPPQEEPLRIKWCDGHWADLIFALKDRGLGEEIAETPEELNESLINGKGDPCWDAASYINMGAVEIFGAEKVVKQYGGCPVCAFANIVQHAADIAKNKRGVTH